MTASPKTKPNWAKIFPILNWGAQYGRQDLQGDLTAAVIVTIMLIPQSLAYALLAGLPPEVGLYASILPLVAYALLGSSRVLAVGPVAVVSLMSASALAPLGLEATADYVAASAVLALMSGTMLLLMGALKLGLVANLLSHPVIAGFITASGLLIAASQVKHILGISAAGHNLPEIITSLGQGIGQTNPLTFVLGCSVLAFLFWIRMGLSDLLQKRFGLTQHISGTIVRVGPVFAIVGTILFSWLFNLQAHGVAVVGRVPTGLPPLGLPNIETSLVAALIGPAALITIIGYVESVSVAQTLAAKRRQKIDPNQELTALGAANIASGLSGGYAVTGGFARSVVNFDAGARTPAAGALTAIGLTAAAIYLTPLLYFLPTATLSATIIVAVLSLVDLSILKRAWTYSRADFAAVLVTIVLTLLVGVETGVGAGVVTSVLLFLWKTSRPHVAEVGQVPGSEHFRNIDRHEVITDPRVVALRIDESLYFANARRMEDLILERVHAGEGQISHVILMFSAVNEVDLSALESLEAINHQLHDLGVTLHLSEVKGPVMDRLKRSSFLAELTGEVFLSQNGAFHHVLGLLAHNTPSSVDGAPED